jgi:hypothetical protein
LRNGDRLRLLAALLRSQRNTLSLLRPMSVANVMLTACGCA